MEVKINWDIQRSKHALERMILRGISQEEIKEAIIKGNKKTQGKDITEAFLRYYSIVYEEKVYKKQNVRKVFPITVKLW